MKKFMIALLATTISTSVMAQDVPHELDSGKYSIKSKTGSVSLTIVYLQMGMYAANAQVIQNEGECEGSFSGIGKWDAKSKSVKILAMSNVTNQSSNPESILELQFNKSTKKFSIKEIDADNYHGMNCTYNSNGLVVSK